MKTSKILLTGFALVFLFTACNKNKMTPAQKGMKHGYLYNEWILDDDSKTNHDITQNGTQYHNQKDPQIEIIKKDNRYILTYTNASNNNAIKEKGTWMVNEDAETITYMPEEILINGSTTTGNLPAAYTFHIKKLVEENFVTTASYPQTTYSTDAEGVQHATVTDVEETMYFTDND